MGIKYFTLFNHCDIITSARALTKFTIIIHLTADNTYTFRKLSIQYSLQKTWYFQSDPLLIIYIPVLTYYTKKIPIMDNDYTVKKSPETMTTRTRKTIYDSVSLWATGRVISV